MISHQYQAKESDEAHVGTVPTSLDSRPASTDRMDSHK